MLPVAFRHTVRVNRRDWNTSLVADDFPYDVRRYQPRPPRVRHRQYDLVAVKLLGNVEYLERDIAFAVVRLRRDAGLLELLRGVLQQVVSSLCLKAANLFLGAKAQYLPARYRFRHEQHEGTGNANKTLCNTLGLDIDMASVGTAPLLPDQKCILALHMRTTKEVESLDRIRRDSPFDLSPHPSSRASAHASASDEARRRYH